MQQYADSRPSNLTTTPAPAHHNTTVLFIIIIIIVVTISSSNVGEVNVKRALHPIRNVLWKIILNLKCHFCLWFALTPCSGCPAGRIIRPFLYPARYSKPDIQLSKRSGLRFSIRPVILAFMQLGLKYRGQMYPAKSASGASLSATCSKYIQCRFMERFLWI